MNFLMVTPEGVCRTEVSMEVNGTDWGRQAINCLQDQPPSCGDVDLIVPCIPSVELSFPAATIRVVTSLILRTFLSDAGQCC